MGWTLTILFLIFLNWTSDPAGDALSELPVIAPYCKGGGGEGVSDVLRYTLTVAVSC